MVHDTVDRAAQGDTEARSAAVEDIRRLGRFAEPVLELAIRNAPQEVQAEAWGRFQQAR